MYIPLDFNWTDLIGLLPFIFGIGKKEAPTQPTTAAPTFTPTPLPTGGAGTQWSTPYGQLQPVTSVFNQAEAAAASGNYTQAATLYRQGFSEADRISSEAQNLEDRNLRNAIRTEAGRLVDSGATIVPQYEQKARAAQDVMAENERRRLQAQAEASRLRLETAVPQTQELQLQELAKSIQPSALEIELQQLSLENAKRERERLATAGTVTPATVTPKIDPLIAGDIYGNLSSAIEKETAEADKVITGDLASRGLIGSGIEQDIRRQLRERKQQRLDEAQRFANTKSVELGLQTGDLDLRRQLAQQAATQFNVGIGAEVQAKGQERALERFGTLAGSSDSALNRLLAQNQLRTESGLRQREQDISIFDTITKRAQEERERKRKTLESVFAPFGEAAGLFGGVALSRAAFPDRDRDRNAALTPTR